MMFRNPSTPGGRRGPPALPMILCVDDEIESLTAIRRCLRTEAYDLTVAGSPAEALLMMSKRRPDLVIADECMPHMTGTALLGEVHRQSPRTGRILITGFPGATVIGRGLEAGVDTFVFKPWESETLRQTIRRLLEKTYGRCLPREGEAEEAPPADLPD